MGYACIRNFPPRVQCGKAGEEFHSGVSGHTSLLGDHQQWQVTVASVGAWCDGWKRSTAIVVFPFRLRFSGSNDRELNKLQNPHQGTLRKTMTSGPQKQKAIKTKDSQRSYHRQKEALQMSVRPFPG